MDRNDFRRRAGILNELDSGSYQITPQDVDTTVMAIRQLIKLINSGRMPDNQMISTVVDHLGILDEMREAAHQVIQARSRYAR